MKSENERQELADKLWRREGGPCVSYLIASLAHAYDGLPSEKSVLLEQAYDLAAPILDYEEAAIGAGWVRREIGGWRHDEAGTEHGVYATAQDVCEALDIEPYEREVFEHWIVSDWLADKLIAKCEKVDKEFADLCIWARTTSGQSIALDDVMQRIASEVFSPAQG